ncbi:amine oxidase, flavin-containing [Klebsiella pneumoniae]|uniref:Amine oxidase, flavin-containing n=1 Tax=Klebsiella pneumoniae TaxID=573 RepID=A0A378FV73_KLEPN|nr:amine oxidase, flavin-containing [Klebsiella pneumoniae]
MNIAIIGSGIAGLTCAWRLAGHHQVTLFEAGATPGGHTATVDVSTPQGTWAIDTGFIVYNDRTYPRFMGLLSELGIAGQKTQMSFSVHNPASGLEYNGHSLTSLFAQRRNLLKPAFWGLLSEIVRFNRLAKLAADRGAGSRRDAGELPHPPPLQPLLRPPLYSADGDGHLVVVAAGDAPLPAAAVFALL